MMASNGGMVTPDTARRFPVLHDGIGACRRRPDVGASWHRPGPPRHPVLRPWEARRRRERWCAPVRPLRTYELEVARVHEFKPGSGVPIKIPVIDMIEIGAGGGSIAEIDGRGMIRVGPRSAGADPGPACYGQRGEAATLTDANVVLGYLDPDFFLGGEMRLDPRASRKSDCRARGRSSGRLGGSGGLGNPRKPINEDVARAFRVHAAERGFDYPGLYHDRVRRFRSHTCPQHCRQVEGASRDLSAGGRGYVGAGPARMPALIRRRPLQPYLRRRARGRLVRTPLPASDRRRPSA